MTIIELPSGSVSCRLCGAATEPPTNRRDVYWTTPLDSAANPGGRPKPPSPEPLGLCSACQQLHNQAAALVEARPKITNRFGNVIAVLTAEQTLIALNLLGADPISADTPDSDVLRLMRQLPDAARPLLWIAGYEPIARRKSGLCASEPFGHVTEEDLLPLKRASLNAFARTLTLDEPPVLITPPSFTRRDRRQAAGNRTVLVELGCSFCGIGAVQVDATQVFDMTQGCPGKPEDVAATIIWRRAELVRSQLGRSRSPQRIRGWLCADCRQVAESHGAASRFALERAIAEWAGVHHDPRVNRMTGVIAYAALVSDAVAAGGPVPEPGRERFEHLGEREQVTERLRRGPGSSQEDQGIDADAVIAALKAKGVDLDRLVAR